MRGRLLVVGCWLLVGALQARAAIYYVTVAGLGGEPDYEQRFTANAKDLDKTFKGAGSSAHVYTLTGKDATRARLTEVLASVARDAKAEDDFVLVLIGHGSFDGVEYKFNLVGPDVSGDGAGGDVRQDCFAAAVDCGYDERQWRCGCCVEAAGAWGGGGDEVGYGEECYGVCAVLGGGFAGSGGGCGQERFGERAGGF